ncbi:MAG: sulfite exporter TauE/SafE family protein [Methanoregula sp.]|nr:sulfite exporter TauE/SafE family protein [Methanoregula sp.]
MSDGRPDNLEEDLTIVYGYSIAFLIAAGIGMISSGIGLGGGFLYVPTLTLIFGFDQKMAVGTSLAVMVFSSFAATICYHRQGKILYSAAVLLVVPAIIFAAVGSAITPYIDARILVVFFVIVLLIMSLQMLCPHLRIVREIGWGAFVEVSARKSGDSDERIRLPYLHLVVWGAMGGLISGTTGISGGVLFVPALVVTGIPVHYAVATSLFAIILSSLSGATTHAALGDVSLPFVAIYGAGAAIGAYTGAYVASRFPADQIKKFFAIMLIFIALLMIQQKILGGFNP